MTVTGFEEGGCHEVINCMPSAKVTQPHGGGEHFLLGHPDQVNKQSSSTYVESRPYVRGTKHGKDTRIVKDRRASVSGPMATRVVPRIAYWTTV